MAQRPKSDGPFPAEIVIGRNSFIDIGPPFNYYDLTFLRSDGNKTDVERVSLTPPADACYPRAEIELKHLKLDEPLSSLLEGTNPCTIPEKKLKAELKRRKQGSVFSGMNVSMQVQCGERPRVIRADILDRDIFEEHPNTPEYTAWSQALFEKLDKATGGGRWDKPIFPISNPAKTTAAPTESAALQAIADGKFDSLFGDAPDRPSVLYRLSHNLPRTPFIELTKSDPVHPATYIDPLFPPLAKMARVHGVVEFHLTIGADGSPRDISIDSGPKMLWQSVIDAAAKWKFSPGDAGKTVNGAVRFGLNCASEDKQK